MKKSILLIMAITVLSKFLGLFRDIALTYFYGASSVTDVYLIAQTIPSSLFSVIGAALATSFIPLYQRIRKEEGEKEVRRFTSNVMSAILMILTIIVLVVLIFTPQVIMLYASGFTGESLEAAVIFTRISIIGIYFTGIIYILRSYLHIHEKFIVPALLGIPLNFVSIFSYYAASKTDDRVLAYGIVIAAFIQFAILIPSAYKLGLRYKGYFNIKDPHLKAMLVLAVPVFFGVSVNQISVIVDKNIASHLIVGGISALSYARKLNGFVQGLFIAPIITVIYPKISKFVIHNEMGKLKNTVYESLVSISILVIPATVGAVVLSRPIVELVFMRGAFDEQAVVLTATALKYYALGMLVYAFRDIFARIFYAYNDTRTPMINAVITVSIDVVLNVVLSRIMGIGGLALSTSISAVVSAVLLAGSLRKKIPELSFIEPLVSIVKLTAASLFMGIFASVVFNASTGYVSGNLSLLISIFSSAGVYILLVFLFKIPEAYALIRFFKESIEKYFKRRRNGGYKG